MKVKLIKSPTTNHHPNQLSKGYTESAAHDLYLPQDTTLLVLNANESRVIDLGIAIHIDDPGVAGIILPRSGSGSKGLVVGNLTGLIDQDYQGPLKVCLWNRTDDQMKVDVDKAVAQLYFQKIEQVQFEEVDNFDSKTERGAGGFGSSDEKEIIVDGSQLQIGMTVRRVIEGGSLCGPMRVYLDGPYYKNPLYAKERFLIVGGRELLDEGV